MGGGQEVGFRLTSAITGTEAHLETAGVSTPPLDFSRRTGPKLPHPLQLCGSGSPLSSGADQGEESGNQAKARQCRVFRNKRARVLRLNWHVWHELAKPAEAASQQHCPEGCLLRATG